MLEDGKYSPLTGTICFFMAPAILVAQRFHTWQAPLYKRTTASLEICSRAYTRFDDIMNLLQPLTSRATKWVFVPVGENISAMFSNCWTGLDPSPLSSLAVNHCNTKGIRMTVVSRNHRGKRYDSRILEVYSPDAEDPFRVERSIYCANDGGKWKFGTSGKPYPFEDISKYKNKNIRERFSASDVWAFLSHFNINANNEEFYINSENGMLHEVFIKGGPLPNIREVALEDL